MSNQNSIFWIPKSKCYGTINHILARVLSCLSHNMLVNIYQCHGCYGYCIHIMPIFLVPDLPDWVFQLDPLSSTSASYRKDGALKVTCCRTRQQQGKEEHQFYWKSKSWSKNLGESHVCLKHGYWRSLRSSLSRWNRRKTTKREL